MSFRTTFRTLALASTLVAGTLFAQAGGDDQPAMAMGAGRMIRGTVTAVAPDHLTLKTDTGETYAVALSPNTQIRKGRDPGKVTDIHVGDGVGAMGEVDRPAKTVHALFLALVDAEQVRKLKEDMGKTYIAGKVTAIDEVKLTILRSDGVTQVIQADEDTSFRRGGRSMQVLAGDGAGMGINPGGDAQRTRPRNGNAGPRPDNGGESITLADIKVGDTVIGRGALKKGIFVPTELGVADPTARGAGRNRQPRDPAGPQTPRQEPK